MNPLQIVYLWGPSIIAFASFLIVVISMLGAWRSTGNKGFLFLAIVAAASEAHFLFLKFGAWLFPALGGVSRATFHAWVSALLALAGAMAWRLLRHHLRSGDTIPADSTSRVVASRNPDR